MAPDLEWKQFMIAVNEDEIDLIQTKTYGPGHDIPLHVCSLSNNLKGLKLLLSHGGDIEKLNVYGHTPFLMALEYGGEVVIQFMIKYLQVWRINLFF